MWLPNGWSDPGVGSDDPRTTLKTGNITVPVFFLSLLQRQPAFDTFDGSLFAIFPSLNEKQALQEVPTGLDSISYGSLLPRPPRPARSPRVTREGRGQWMSHECLCLESGVKSRMGALHLGQGRFPFC